MEFVQLKFIFPLLCVVFLIHSVDAHHVRYCDKKGNYPVKVKAVEIYPDPVVSGELATFSITASSDRRITGGELVIEVSYFGLHVHTEKHDLCTETSCPIGGDFVITHSQALPGFTPPGSYNLKMKMVTGGSQQLTCASFDFSIVFSSGVADS